MFLVARRLIEEDGGQATIELGGHFCSGGAFAAIRTLSDGSLRRRFSLAANPVGGIEQVKSPHRIGKQDIIAPCLLARPLEHRFQPFGVGYRDTAHVQEVDGGTSGCEG